MLSRCIAAAVGMAGSLALVTTHAQAAGPPLDVEFAQAAHQTNLAEITAGRIAWKRTDDPEVKKLAEAFMRHHITLDAALSRTARLLEISLPTTPTSEQQALAARYESAGADVFDEYFISTQLAAYLDAQRLVAAQAEQGAIPELKEIAEASAQTIALHQEMLRKASAPEPAAAATEPQRTKESVPG